jgi:phytoene synthase
LRVNFDLYCQQKAAPAGSASYYALRRAARPDRSGATALLAYREELAQTVYACTDLSVGQAKFAWWRQEVQSLDEVADRPPSHPVTRALAARLPNPSAELAALQKLAESYAKDLEQTRYFDSTQLDDYLRGTAGESAQLLARCAGMHEERALGAVAQLGQGIALAQLLCDVGLHARRGRIYLPVDALQQFSVPAADLIGGRYSAEFAALMAFQTERARDLIGQAFAQLRADTQLARSSWAVSGAQAVIAQALLKEIEAERFNVLQQRILLTPLRMFWLTCRGPRFI